MKTVKKYKLDIATEQIICLPNGFQFLSLVELRGDPYICCLVNTDSPPTCAKVFMYPTDNPLPGDFRAEDFIGILPLHRGDMALHVFFQIGQMP